MAAAACPTWAAWTSNVPPTHLGQESEGRLSRAALFGFSAFRSSHDGVIGQSYRGPDYLEARRETESDAAGAPPQGKALLDQRVWRKAMPAAASLHVRPLNPANRIARLSICIYRYSRSSLLQPILTPGEPNKTELLNAGCRGSLETGRPDFFSGHGRPRRRQSRRSDANSP